MKKTISVLIPTAALLLLTLIVWAADEPAPSGYTTAQAEPNDDNPQSTTGPVPPPEVLKRDAEKALRPAPQGALGTEKVISSPPYLWRHGCGPTAMGMVIGYYDERGYDKLISGNASTQTDAVNQAIASQGDAAHPRHYEDYSLPRDDTTPTILLDKSEPPVGDEHPSDCIADFMKTSWSAANNRYGWSRAENVGPSFVSYVNMRNPAYGPTYGYYKTSTGTMTWSVLTTEIDNNRPMVFLVDTTADGQTDHFVTVIGYRDQPSQQYGCWDTWSTTIRWENFQPMANGVPWGISRGWSFYLATPPPIGDFDNNNSEDMVDFAIFASAWMSLPGQSNWNPVCDISDPNDNIIDWKDLAAFVQDWLVILIPGDFDDNNREDMADFAIFASAWMSLPGQPGWNPACDISDPNDNIIDWKDLAVFTQDWLAGVE